MDEVELITRARSGDGRAVRQLYDAYAPRVYAVVRRLAADDALAEDWAQDAWIRAIRALPSFRGDSRFSTWIHRIAVNSALHGRRARERRLKLEAQSAPPASIEPPSPSLRLTLEQALDQLPDGMRRVIVLHDAQGYTHEEIGEMLGVAAGTSKSQLFKARARLRTLIEPPERIANEEPETQVCRT
jgi:RNA polymerase sigma-70 factor, ECF subfamily